MRCNIIFCLWVTSLVVTRPFAIDLAGTFQGCETCCGYDQFDASGKCVLGYCFVKLYPKCVSVHNWNCMVNAGTGVTCCELRSGTLSDAKLHHARCASQSTSTCSYVYGATSGSNYWAGCVAGKGPFTLSGTASGRLYDGTYDVVSTLNLAALTVMSSAIVGSASLGSPSIASILGTASAVTLNVANGAVFVGGSVLTMNANSFSVSISVTGVIGTLASSGSPTISGSGTVTTHLQNGGTVVFPPGLTVNTFRGFGTVSVLTPMTAMTMTGTSSVSIASTVAGITIAGALATITVGVSGLVTNVIDQGGSNNPTLFVYRFIGTALCLSGRTTVFQGGTVTSHTQLSGVATIHSGGAVSTLCGAGSFTIAGSVGSFLSTAGSATLSVSGTVSTFTIAAASSVSITKTSNAASTISVSSGGLLATYCQSGGAVQLHNAGTVSSMCGAGAFDIFSGRVSSLSVSGTASVTIRSGASVGHLMVGGPHTSVTILDGLVDSIAVVTISNSLDIALTGSNGAIRSLSVPFALSSLSVTANGGSVGGLLITANVSNVSVSCSGVHLLDRGSPLFLSSSHLASLKIALTNCDGTFATSPVISIESFARVSSLFVQWSATHVNASGSDAIVVKVPVDTLHVSVDHSTVTSGRQLLLFEGSISNGVVTMTATTLLTLDATCLMSLTGSRSNVSVTIYDVRWSFVSTLRLVSAVRLSGTSSFRDVVRFASSNVSSLSATAASFEVVGVDGHCRSATITLSSLMVDVPRSTVTFVAASSTSHFTETSQIRVADCHAYSELAQIAAIWNISDSTLVGSRIAVHRWWNATTSLLLVAGSCTRSNVSLSCIDVTSAYCGLVDLQGEALRSRVDIHSVTIRQSFSPRAALVSLSDPLSSNNSVRIARSNVKVATVVVYPGVVVGGDIVVECSSVGTHPMSVGSFPSTFYITVANDACSEDVFHHSCWMTLSRTLSMEGSLSASTTLSVIKSQSLSIQPSSSASVTQTPTLSFSPSLTRSGSGSSTPSLTVTASASISTSTSISETRTRGTPSQSSVTIPVSLSETPKYCECIGNLAQGNVLMMNSSANDTATNASASSHTAAFHNASAFVAPSPHHQKGISEVLLAAKVPRLTMWASLTLAITLATLGRAPIRGPLDSPNITESLCWEPTSAILRGKRYDVLTSHWTSEQETDTVQWLFYVEIWGTEMRCLCGSLPSPARTLTSRCSLRLCMAALRETR
jgi:trimeric autotransporter adhesin